MQFVPPAVYLLHIIHFGEKSMLSKQANGDKKLNIRVQHLHLCYFL